MELAVGPLVDAADARRGVAMPERDEHPYQQVVLRAAGELKDERKRALRRGPVGDRQVQLGAAAQLAAIASERLARQQLAERHARAFKPHAGTGRDLQRMAGEPAYRLAPDLFVKAHRSAVTLATSAFAVGRAHLLDQRLEVVRVGRHGPEPLVRRGDRRRRAELKKLRGEAVHALRHALCLPIGQGPQTR